MHLSERAVIHRFAALVPAALALVIAGCQTAEEPVPASLSSRVADEIARIESTLATLPPRFRSLPAP